MKTVDFWPKGWIPEQREGELALNKGEEEGGREVILRKRFFTSYCNDLHLNISRAAT